MSKRLIFAILLSFGLIAAIAIYVISDRHLKVWHLASFRAKGAAVPNRENILITEQTATPKPIQL